VNTFPSEVDMHLNCKNCGRSILAKNINLERAIAKCSRCRAVFRFAHTKPHIISTKLSKNIRFIRRADKISIVLKRPVQSKSASSRNPSSTSLTIFEFICFISAIIAALGLIFSALFLALGLLAGMICYVSVALDSSSSDVLIGLGLYGKGFWLMIFSLFFAVLFFRCFYEVLILILSETRVYVDRKYLSFRRIPVANFLPVLSNFTIPMEEVERVFCERVVSENTVYSRDALEVKNSYDAEVKTLGPFEFAVVGDAHYMLHLVLKSGRRKKLIVLDEIEDALFLEQEIERFLGIENRPI